MHKQTDIKYIILDTRIFVSRLRSDIRILSKFNADEESILKLIFEHLMNEKKAKLDIAYECLMIVGENRNEEWSNDIVRITNGMVMLADSLVDELQRLRAYRNGRLNYRFYKLLDGDIVLINNYA
jgi:hypothetical protein